MVGYITKSNGGGDFTPLSAGVHLMVCAQVVDLGTQPGSQQFPTPRRKVLIRWEVPGERIEGKPAIHSEKYTWSFHEKATLRQMLENWRGKKFTDEDFAGPPKGFHIRNLLGVPMMGLIVHDEKGDKTYANLKTAMPSGLKDRSQWPKVEGESFFLDLDDFDEGTFAKLSEGWQGIIKGSPEYQAATGRRFDAPEDGYDLPPGLSSYDDLSDDIPF